MNPRAQQRASVLIIVVWILVILTVVAVSLSRRSAIDLSLTSYDLNHLRGQYALWGGYQYALALLYQDSKDEKTSLYDNVYECGIKIPKGTEKDSLFKDLPIGGGRFSIGLLSPGPFGVMSDIQYGFRDEDRKINLNALTKDNMMVLKQLLAILGVEEGVSRKIAAGVVDWRDADHDLVDAAHGQEDQVKNRPFESLSELKLIAGVTPEIYQSVLPFITIYPQTPDRLMVNFSTAPKEVLEAMARSMTGPATNTSLEDGDTVARKIMSFRNGSDTLEGTADDRLFEDEKISFNVKERAIYLSMTQWKVLTSRFFNIGILAYPKGETIPLSLKVIVDRTNFSVVDWAMD